MTPTNDDALIANTAATAATEANARPDLPTIAFLPDGPRDLPSIEARARALATSISSGPRPLRMGPEAPLSIAPSPESTDAPASKSEIDNAA